MRDTKTKGYEFLDNKGTFRLEGADAVSYLYFPIAGEQGMKGAVTPNLGGDLKRGQNEFVLQPVSAEDLHNNRSTRNFWYRLNDGRYFSARAHPHRRRRDVLRRTETAGRTRR